MFTKTLKRFRSLPKETQAMVYLYWIYEFAELIVQIFMAAFVFLNTGSIPALMAYAAVYFTGIAVGFSGWGYLVSRWKVSMRLNYLRSFVIYTLSYVCLLVLPHTLPYFLLFALLNGLGLGMIWLGIHTYEMLYTTKKNRDFYSSMTSAGGQTMSIVAPFIATLTFLISEHWLQADTFTVLLWMLPFTYIFSIPFLFRLPDYVPPPVTWKGVKQFFQDEKLKDTRRFYWFQSVDWGIWAVIFPFMALGALETVVNIGILETVMGIVSLLTVIFLSHHRHEDNRLKILGYATAAYAVAYAFSFFWWKSALFYVVFSLMHVILGPIYRVSEHVIDLHSIEHAAEQGDDFYTPLLIRDLLLAASRLLGVGALAVIYWVVRDDFLTVQAGIILAYIFLLLIYVLAKRMVQSSTPGKTA